MTSIRNEKSTTSGQALASFEFYAFELPVSVLAVQSQQVKLLCKHTPQKQDEVVLKFQGPTGPILLAGQVSNTEQGQVSVKLHEALSTQLSKQTFTGDSSESLTIN